MLLRYHAGAECSISGFRRSQLLAIVAMGEQAKLTTSDTVRGTLRPSPQPHDPIRALLRAGNDKLLMLEDGGDLILLDPNPKEYRELARSKVCGETWAHPGLSNGRLYVRDNQELICLQPGRTTHR